MTPVAATLNQTGTTLCKIWDDLCLPDSPSVRAVSARMDVIVKAYCRGDTSLVADWVQTARALSDASVAAKGKPLPAEFVMAPIVVARGVTEKGTPVPPPAVVVTTVDAKGKPTEAEVAVLANGQRVQPQGAMPVAVTTGPGYRVTPDQQQMYSSQPAIDTSIPAPGGVVDIPGPNTPTGPAALDPATAVRQASGGFGLLVPVLIGLAVVKILLK